MKKIILLLYVASVAFAGDYQFRQNIVPASASTLNIGSASYPWDEMYIGIIHGHVQFPDYPLFKSVS